MDRKLPGVEVLPEVEAIAVLELDGSEDLSAEEPSVTQPSESESRRRCIRHRFEMRLRRSLCDPHFPEPRLADAAHIVMDMDEQLGQPVVSNGVPLTKIHHAAFDAFR
jgi:HNH endonuclease